LPGLVATQFFWRHFHTRFFQLVGNRIDVIHFKTKMMHSLAPEFGCWIGLEKFDVLSGGDLEVKAEQLAVLEKIEMRFEPERAAIEIAGALQILREDTKVRE
jgi:hypothetical protein